MRIAGAVGSLSLTDAAVSITDANGQLVTSTTSDALARFSVEVPPDAALPLQLVASSGLDLLYDSPTSLVQAAVIETPGSQTINVSPLSTMIAAMIECSRVPLSASAAWNLMAPQFAMGLPASANPLTTEISEVSAPALMLANALLEETLRRAETALDRAGYPSSGNGILDALACDLIDDGAFNGTPESGRQLAAARGAEAAVLLEIVADRLTIDGQLAAPRFDGALATLLGRSDLTASGVSESVAVIEQARRAALLFADSVQSAEARLAIAALGGSPQQVAADLQALDYEPVRSELNALVDRMAGADTSALTALKERMRAQAASSPPISSFAASASIATAGEAVQLTWATSGAEACVAEGDWAGNRSGQGTYTTEPLQSSTRYALTCLGLGGVTSRTIDVGIAETSTQPPVGITLSASRTIVDAGDRARLTWAASNADSCTASGAWRGDRPTTGSEETGPLAEPATYRLDCTGPGGEDSASVVVGVAVPASAPPTLTLSASASTVAVGSLVGLSWTSSDADVCWASGGWSGSQPVQGSEVLAVNADVSFSLRCTGPGGSSSRTVSVTASNPPEPMVSLSAADPSVSPGDSTTLSWVSSDATDCQASGNWSGSRPPDGSASSGPLSEPGTFTLVCSGPGGSASSSIDIEMLPEINLNLSSDRVLAGDYVQISWSSTDTDSCSASGDWTGARATSGSEAVGPLQADATSGGSQSTGSFDGTKTFTLTCTGPGGTDSATLAVAIDDLPEPTVTLSADDEWVDAGNGTRLHWSAEHADSCEATGAWSGARTASGSEEIGPLTSSSTFSLSCSNAAGNAISMVTVGVPAQLTLNWVAPTENVDGSTLDDLSHYRVYYGAASRDYTEQVDVSDPGATSVSIAVAPGSYFVAMTAIDAAGNESALSNEVEKEAR